MARSRKQVSGEVNLIPQPKQEQLVKLVTSGQATWIGYGGSRGAAKSAAVRLAIMILAFAQDDAKTRFLYPQGRALVFRRKFTDLWENHISKFFTDWPITRSFYNTQTKEMTFPSGFIVKFGYAEHEGDIKDFQGKEYRWIFVDEATHLTQSEIEFLKTCNRAPNCAEHQCKMVLTMNPGGVGHKFIKRIFYDKQYVGNERPEAYAFIQAYGWDNIEWVRPALAELWGPAKNWNDHNHRYYFKLDDQQRFNLFVTRSDYGRILDALPESMRVGHLLGRWDIFAGQYFDIFNTAQHCYRPEQRRLEPWHSKWISIDWGFAHPAAIHWFAQDGPVTRTYRELVDRGKGPRELASLIVAKSGDEKPEAIYLGPDAFAKRTDADTIAQQMGEVFREVGWPDPTPADNDRVGGWALMYDLLKHGKWEISELCSHLIATLPAMARDTRDGKNVEDCIKFNAGEGKFDGDDPADSARYGLKSRIASHSKPVEVKIEEAISTQKSQGYLTDPTSEMIRRAQMREKMQHAAGPIHFAYRRGRSGSSRGSRRPVPFS